MANLPLNSTHVKMALPLTRYANGNPAAQNTAQPARTFAQSVTVALGSPQQALQADDHEDKNSPATPVLAPLPGLLLRQIEELSNLAHSRQRKRQRKG